MTKSFQLPMNVQQMLAQARLDTGIAIQDEQVIEPLSVLAKSLNEESNMHEIGANELQVRILQMLKNRLRMLRDFQAHPEISEQQVRAPIMISGTLRTGSTKLQRLFSESGDFNWLPFWKVYNFASFTGKPNEDVAERIAEVDSYIAYNSRVSPEIDLAHKFETYAPEEETLIAMQTFRSPSWFGYGNIPSYMQWVSQQDLTPTFEFVRDALKYLQWQGLADPNKRWILKSPFNVGLEDMISSVFPDACFVVTHRQPAQTLPSLFSLLKSLIKCHSNEPQVDSYMTMLGQTMTLERHMQLREIRPDIPMLDVHFKDSFEDLEGVVRRVYELAKEPLTTASLDRMMNWDATNPMHKHGVHKYTLDDFGLTKSQIEESCPNYSAFYNSAFQ